MLPTKTPTQKQRCITSQNAYLITQALRDVIQKGTGRLARILKCKNLAGKTGTTNQQLDGWFAGFSPDLVAVTWMGYDQSRSLEAFASRTALPIWIQFMRQALQQYPVRTFPRPPGLVTVRIDPETGKLASPQQNNAIFETFRNQYAPKTQNTYTTQKKMQSTTQHDVEWSEHLF